MKMGCALVGLDKALKAEMSRAERAITSGMSDGTDGLKNELRQQVIAAGMGRKLANTWQGRVYPEGQASADAAGYVFSKAPAIIDFNMRDATVLPIAGHRFFAIPTKNVPRQGRYRRPMTVEQVEASFNQDLTLRRGKRGRLLGFVEAVRARSQRRPGVRQATRRRVAAQRRVEMIHMFTFVPSIHGRKRLDPDSAAKRWAARTALLIENRLGGG